MQEILGEIPVGFTDAAINKRCAEHGKESGNYLRHFNQSEEFFITLRRAVSVPHLPFHHDVHDPRPSADYLAKLRRLFDQIILLAPDVFADLTYVFDPGEVLRPLFYQLFSVREMYYLYLLRVNLAYRPNEHEVIERGTNDITASYQSQNLMIEADLLPLSEVRHENGKIRGFRVEQSVSQTWIGETGRGYFVQGIWIDRELTRFFTKLFVPPGKKIYPYYPFSCKYRAISHNVINLDPAGRKQSIPLLVSARDFLLPHMERIQNSLSQGIFSPELETFQELKAAVPESWNAVWSSLRPTAYLNDKDMKEWILEET